MDAQLCEQQTNNQSLMTFLISTFITVSNRCTTQIYRVKVPRIFLSCFKFLGYSHRYRLLRRGPAMSATRLCDFDLGTGINILRASPSRTPKPCAQAERLPLSDPYCPRVCHTVRGVPVGFKRGIKRVTKHHF
jgi:hypothetical protein